MVEPDGNKQSCHTVEDEAPRKGFLIAEHKLQHASSRNQHTIAEDNCQAIERVANAHEPHLLVVVKFEHVVAVCRYVMRSTGERHEEEEGHRALKPERRIERKGDTRQGRA